MGIITFNQKQQSLIQDRIDELAEADIEFASAYRESMKRPLDERIFVKNIENVQGDERDIIVFSMAYGPGHDGRVRAWFGVLNNAGGENRLNVAISRAKQRIFLFSSDEPEELHVENTRNDGPKYLKWYMQYARAVGNSDVNAAQHRLKELTGGALRREDTSSMLIFDSGFEEQVHEAISEAGYTVDTQVGASGYRIDLAVQHPDQADRYVLGIECDGATYHSARSVRERDVYRQAFLESRGWAIDRIWSRNWWNNRDGEVAKIRDRIEEVRVVDRDHV